MRNQDNGGPVFPSVAGMDPRTGETLLASVGMSLRQHYAGLAMAALIQKFGDDDGFTRDAAAVEAVREADALLGALEASK